MRVDYTVGTMIELPRACVIADKIAEHADFFSFGTNDLTQTTFGLSRDDAGRFLPAYIEQGLLLRDPFVELDREGVGGADRIGIERGRSAQPRAEGRHLRRARRRPASPSSSATRRASTTSRARRTACPSRASPPARPHSRASQR